jgi:hypothetical protein
VDGPVGGGFVGSPDDAAAEGRCVDGPDVEGFVGNPGGDVDEEGCVEGFRVEFVADTGTGARAGP